MVNPRLRCIVTNDPHKLNHSHNQNHNDHDVSIKKTLWLEQEEGKKSSFLLQVPADFSIDKPAHLFIDCVVNNNETHPFLFGGLEILSNSRNVEAYTKESSSQKDETYLLTARGIKEDGDTHIHRSVLVSPNGPGTVNRLHLKLLSIRPATATNLILISIKLKGRLPSVEMSTSSAPEPATTTTAAGAGESTSTTPSLTASQQPPSLLGMNQNDLTSAMMGITMLVGSTEKRISKGLREGLTDLDVTVGKQILRLEHGFGTILQSFQLALERQNTVLQQQQETILNQTIMIQALQEQQIQMLTTVLEMRGDMKEQKETAALLLMENESRENTTSFVEQESSEHIDIMHSDKTISETPIKPIHSEFNEAADKEDACTNFIADKEAACTDVIPGKDEDRIPVPVPKLWIPDPDDNEPMQKMSKDEIRTILLVEENEEHGQPFTANAMDEVDVDLINFSDDVELKDLGC